MRFLLVVFFCATGAFSQTTAVKPHMQEFFAITGKLRPYLTDKISFMDPKNETQIAAALTEFNTKVSELKQEKMSNNDDMKFRAQLLAEGLNDAEKSFRDGFKDYSFWVLRCSMNNCSACHTQKSLGGTDYKFEKNPKINPFADAEFLFIVRNYTDSTAIFEDLLNHYPENKLSVEDLETSLQKLLYYYVRVLHDDQKTLNGFEKFLKNQNLPSSVRNDILAWKKYLNVKKYRLTEEKTVTTPKQLQEFIDTREAIAGHYKLSRQRQIVDLETSHYLFQFLEKNQDAKLKPWILYWLASQEKDYRLTMFDLTAEQYLKECIEKYPRDTAAKKCFELFKEIKTEAFTGSRGTQIPQDVSAQLRRYEKLINQK